MIDTVEYGKFNNLIKKYNPTYYHDNKSRQITFIIPTLQWSIISLCSVYGSIFYHVETYDGDKWKHYTNGVLVNIINDITFNNIRCSTRETSIRELWLFDYPLKLSQILNLYSVSGKG